MTYDTGLVARVEDALATLGERGVRQRNVFGGRGFLSTRSTFAIVYEDELIVKLPRSDYDRCLTVAGVRPFAPGDERPMNYLGGGIRGRDRGRSGAFRVACSGTARDSVAVSG